MRNAVIYSYRGGTGKTTLVANLAVALCKLGVRVGVMDLDLVSPGLNVLFGADGGEGIRSVLQEEREIDRVVVDLTPRASRGKLFLIPGCLSQQAIMSILKGGYEAAAYIEALKAFARKLDLGLTLIDTHPGFEEDTLINLAICDEVVMVLRPDAQDWVGSLISAEVIRRLRKPFRVLVNMASRARMEDGTPASIAQSLQAPLLGVVPFYEEVLSAMSREVFTLTREGHPFTGHVEEIARRLVRGG